MIYRKRSFVWGISETHCQCQRLKYCFKSLKNQPVTQVLLRKINRTCYIFQKTSDL